MSYRDYDPVDLANVNFKIHQLEGLEKDNIENAFVGHISQVLGRINDGKEATVYLCQGAVGGEHRLLAAKIFKARQFRHFNTDRNYRNFGKMRDRRMAKAMRGGSKKGEQAFHKQWVQSEWRMLNRLYDAGVSVPEPVAWFADGVLMTFIGDESQGPAPRLVNCSLDERDVKQVADQLTRDITKMLSIGVVHGDLSAYNILVHDGRAVIIDVPQAMDLATTPTAFGMMQRDLGHLETFFERQGLITDFVSLLKGVYL